jgi:hypothetical protein
MTFVMALPGMSNEETLASIELFGKEVLPHLQAYEPSPRATVAAE